MYHVGPGTTQAHHKTMKQYTEPRKSQTLFGLSFVQTIPSPQLGFLSGVLTRITKRENTYQLKLTLLLHKK